MNKFDGFDVERDGAGNPYVKDHALARFSCKVVEKLDLGTYMLYIAETTEAEVLARACPDRGRLQERRGLYSAHRHCGPNRRQRGLRCTICGYVAEKETLPDGYQCPICRANKDKFVKL